MITKFILIKMNQFNLVKVIIKHKNQKFHANKLNNYLIYFIFQKLLKIIKIKNLKAFHYVNKVIIIIIIIIII